MAIKPRRKRGRVGPIEADYEALWDWFATCVNAHPEGLAISDFGRLYLVSPSHAANFLEGCWSVGMVARRGRRPFVYFPTSEAV